jgi:hypothetical protein
MSTNERSIILSFLERWEVERQKVSKEPAVKRSPVLVLNAPMGSLNASDNY